MKTIFLTFSTDVWQSCDSYKLEGVSNSLKKAQHVVKRIFDGYGDNTKAVIEKTEINSNCFDDLEVYEFYQGLEYKNGTSTELGYLAQPSCEY